MATKITIIGAGSFGTALGTMLDKYGSDITIWSPFKEQIDALIADGENKRLLPNIKIEKSISLTTDKASALKDAQFVIIATPSGAVRETSAMLREYISDNVIVICVAKGLEDNSYKTLDQVISEELPNNPVVILSGPSHAEEIALGMPTTVVVASKDLSAAEAVQDALMNEVFRIYVNDDVTGVELGGALKNVIAIATGVLEGLGAGDNTKAALMTRGMSEISRLGVARGGRLETFGGLSGMGDLIVTCSSEHSRNRRCGILIGKGVPPKEAIEQIGMVVEGFNSTKNAYMLAQKLYISMPITEQAYYVLFENKNVKEAISALMTRPKRHEIEDIWLNPKNL